MRTEKDTETMDLYNKYNASEWLTRKEAIRRKRLVTIFPHLRQHYSYLSCYCELM